MNTKDLKLLKQKLQTLNELETKERDKYLRDIALGKIYGPQTNYPSIEKLDNEAGKEVVFDKVLMVNGVAGKPYLTNVVVKGEVVKHGRQKKVVVFKYKQKNNYHKKQGHRQPYTKVKITSIEER